MSSRGLRPPGDEPWPPSLAGMRDDLERARAEGRAPPRERARPPVVIDHGPRQSGRTRRHLGAMLAELAGGRASSCVFVSQHSRERDYVMRMFRELAPAAEFRTDHPPTFELPGGSRVYFYTADMVDARGLPGLHPSIPLFVDHCAVEQFARQWLRMRGLG